MTNLDLQLIFFQNTITYTGATKLKNDVFIIDSILSSICFANDQILCTILYINYSFNHAVTQAIFSMNISKFFFIFSYRLFKNTL